MTYSKILRNRFPEISLRWEDLLLLESFQIAYLPDRVTIEEFATLLHTYPEAYSFLVSKHPPISSFLESILKENKAPADKDLIKEQCQEALWEIGDLIIFNKHPAQFDAHAPIKWEIDEISALTSLEGKILADVGAGAGRITFLVAPMVQTVYAVEPLASFRSFMKEKAVKQSVKNVIIMEGTLDSIPLPDNSLDVLITSNAMAWNLPKELKEIERVVKAGGHAIHLLQSDIQVENPHHLTLSSSPWNYTCLKEKHIKGMKLRYYKEMSI